MTEASLAHVVGTIGQRDQPFFYSWVRTLRPTSVCPNNQIRTDVSVISMEYRFEISTLVRRQEDQEGRRSPRMTMT